MTRTNSSKLFYDVSQGPTSHMVCHRNMSKVFSIVAECRLQLPLGICTQSQSSNSTSFFILILYPLLFYCNENSIHFVSLMDFCAVILLFINKVCCWLFEKREIKQFIFISYFFCRRTNNRDCNSPSPANGGKYCVGQRIEHRTCNIQECENDSLDFREEQCSHFDNDSSFNSLHLHNAKWMPKYGLEKKDECKLFCRLEQSSTYFELKNRVIDGTPCSYHTFDKCINGECIPAGCDNELYSTAEVDMCGVCKGHNETCETFHGNLTYHQFRISSNYQSGYFVYHVATIPKGATNIEINQGSIDDQNYISLRDNHDRSLLNDYRHIDDVHKILHHGGITLDYNGGKSAKERVNSTYSKQLKSDLKIFILSFKLPQPMNEEYIITYSYSRSNPDKPAYASNHVNHATANDYPTTTTAAKKQHVWQMQEWSNCSKLCQGKQTRKASCVELTTKSIVPDGYCRNSAKPYEDFKECNTGCRLNWEAYKSNCSVTCGEGNRTIGYRCMQQVVSRNSGHQKIQVDKSFCPARYETKLYEPCSQHCNEVLWAYSNWSPCSRSCGGGKQNRTHYCISDPVHRRPVDNKYCNHMRPEELVRYCNQNINCAEWAYGEESPVSQTILLRGETLLFQN